MRPNKNQISSLQAGHKVVGKVKDAQGLKGEIFVRLFADRCDWFDSLKTVVLTHEQQIMTAELVKMRLHKNGLVIKMQGLEDRTQAEKLKGWYLEIPESHLISEVGEKLFLNEVMGFRVISKALGEIGPVRGFSGTSYQDTMLVDYKGREVMIPFVKPIVQEISHVNQQIFVDLPEGLLDL